MHKNIRIGLVSLLVLLTTMASGQKNVETPYARYGIGTLEQQGPFRTRAMGGISSGIRDNLTLNYQTPASYSSIDTTSFIFDFGLEYGVIGLREDKMRYTSGDLNFSHIMLGFPITSRWGVAVALLPYSNGTYNISYQSPGTGVSGSVYERHEGSGGYQKVLAGTGVNLFPFLSVGGNLFYTWGEVSRISELLFTGDNNYFHTRKQGFAGLRGAGYEASVQFMLPLQGKRFINAGITFTPAYRLKTDNEDLILRYANIQSPPFSTDTLFHSTAAGTGRLPQSIRAGFSLGTTDKLTAGADICWTKWSDASVPGV